MIKRVDSKNLDFRALVMQLDRYLAKIDGDEYAFYHQFNTIDKLAHCVVIYENGVPLGCGAIKRFDEQSFEIKRMFVHPNARGRGFAKQLVRALENWGAEMGATRTLLETGKRMPDAIGLYQKMGYTSIKNYGHYIGVENSVCFEKIFY